jgi:hypothetical protein
MVLIQLLLPTNSPHDVGDGPTALTKTREDLAARFSGLTAYTRAPAVGLWTSPEGHSEKDDVVMVEVVADRFDREWWGAFVETLRERFEQEAIHVRALPIEMLDEAAT